MPRIRTIKPEFWEDEVTTSLTRDARLLFIATFNNADDEGLLRWSPEKLKAAAFMYDDDVSIADVAVLMAELAEAGVVHPYIGKGSSRLAWIVNFHRHQRINRPQPSKLGPPSLQSAIIGHVYAQRDGWTCHLCDGPVNQRPHFVDDPYSSNGGPDLSSLNASLDHVIPKSKGGTDYPSNIRLAHIGCNKGRANREIKDFTPPQSVKSALSNVLTSTDADSVICVAPFTDEAVNAHDSFTELLPPEREREREREREVEGERDELPSPTPRPSRRQPDKSGDTDIPPGFDDFWNTYGNKVGKAKSIEAYRKALKMPGVTADLLDASAASYVLYCQANNRYLKDPLTWLNGRHWEDSLPEARAPQTNTQSHLSLVQQLAAEQEQQHLREIGGGR